MAKLPLHCRKFHRHASGNLLGYADIRIEALKLTFLGCPVFANADGSYAIKPPQRKRNGADGASAYEPVVEFDNPKVAAAFSAAAAKAVGERFGYGLGLPAKDDSELEAATP